MPYIDFGYFGQLFDPVYSDKADFNTNAKSYYDALARNKEFLKLFTEKLIQLHNELEKDFAEHKEFTQEKINEFQTRLDGIKQEMIDFFNQWLADGVLDEVINQDILNQKVDRSVLSFFTTPEEHGAVGDGIQSDSDALQRAVNSFNGRAGTVVLNGTKKYAIDKSLSVPWNVTIEFNFAEIVPLKTNTFVNGYWLYTNADLSGNTLVNWGGESLQKFSKLLIKNPNDVHPFRVIYNRSRLQMETAICYNIDKFLLKTGNTDRDYSDMITLSGVFLNNCVGEEWLVDLQYNGDGLKIENCHVAGVAAGNWKFLSARFCTGGIIDRQINGDLLFRDCIGVSVRSSHFEHGKIEVVNSSVSFEDIYHWYHADWQPLPITFRSMTGKTTKPSSMKNYYFIYYQNRNAIPKTYQQDHFNVAVIGGALDITNVMRRVVTNIDISLGMESGIRLTTNGEHENGQWGLNKGLYSKKSYVSKSDVYTSIDKVRHDTNFTMYDLAMTTHGSFDLPTGMYYYRAVALFGPINRLIARYLGPEVKGNVTNQNTLPLLNIQANQLLQNATIRLFRGTSPGQYTHVVDVHIANGLQIYDLGYQLGTGEMWQLRAPSGIPNYNYNYEKTLLIGDNIQVTGSTVPTVGEWLVGDELVSYTPSGKQTIVCISTGEFFSEEDPPPVFVTQ